jgi:hypothetical protein
LRAEDVLVKLVGMAFKQFGILASSSEETLLHEVVVKLQIHLILGLELILVLILFWGVVAVVFEGRFWTFVLAGELFLLLLNVG